MFILVCDRPVRVRSWRRSSLGPDRLILMGAAADGANLPKRRREASGLLAQGQAGSIRARHLTRMIQAHSAVGHSPQFNGWVMRAEAEQLVESIKQSVGLLRRHL